MPPRRRVEGYIATITLDIYTTTYMQTPDITTLHSQYCIQIQYQLSDTWISHLLTGVKLRRLIVRMFWSWQINNFYQGKIYSRMHLELIYLWSQPTQTMELWTHKLWLQKGEDEYWHLQLSSTADIYITKLYDVCTGQLLMCTECFTSPTAYLGQCCVWSLLLMIFAELSIR